MRILFFLFLFTLTATLAAANGGNNRPFEISGIQQTQQARPNLPGDFMIEFGMSLFSNAPDTLGLATLRSRAVNIYYLYRFQLGESNFSINPGFGLGLENYMFRDDNVTLQMDGNNSQVVGLRSYISEFAGGNPQNLRKSKLNANYFDIPVELRYSANRTNPTQGFRIAVGGRVGVLFDSKTKFKYEIDDNTKIAKFKESFALNRFRYGINGRIGLGNFSAFYYQNLSNLFRSGRGPEGTEDTKSYMVGISFALF
jgi:hypothetical protein